jgi:hypothetical protein
MQAPQQLSAVSFDLSRLNRRTVTSFYSNLVTRPTGRAVRSALEEQLAGNATPGGACLSILDFSQVRVLDYSCADEIVAKLLLRYARSDRPVDAYFLARGLQDHHCEALDAVLDRHELLLAVEEPDREPRLLGRISVEERLCWDALLGLQQARVHELLAIGVAVPDLVVAAAQRFVSARVAVVLEGDVIRPLPQLSHV